MLIVVPLCPLYAALIPQAVLLCLLAALWYPQASHLFVFLCRPFLSLSCHCVLKSPLCVSLISIYDPAVICVPKPPFCVLNLSIFDPSSVFPLCPFVSLYVSSLSFPGNCSKLNFPANKGFDNIHQSKPDYIAKFPNFTVPMYCICSNN